MTTNLFIDLSIVLGISVFLNLSFFILAFWLKKDLFTDLTYAMTFLITTIIFMVYKSSYNTASYLGIVIITIWSIRLGSFLLVRIIKTKVDHRFDKMRNSFWRFGLFWLSQSIIVWLVNMPMYLLMTFEEYFVEWSLIWIILALGFLILETISDLQKLIWNSTHKNHFINTGMWKISRHPNYFGEYSFWWMIFAFSLSNDYRHEKLIGIIGPLTITISLYKITGVPILEKYGLKKFGNDQKYLEYLNATPCVIPFIGKKGYKEKWKF